MNGHEFFENFGRDIEAAAKNVEGVTKTEGVYETGFAEFTATFEWGTNAKEAKNNVQKMMASFENRFPDDWGNVWYWFGGSQGSMIIFTATSEKYDVRTLEGLLEDKVLPKAKQIAGVDKAWMARVDEKYVKVTLKPAKILHFNLSVANIRRALKSYEMDSSIGKIKLDDGSEFKIA